MNTIEHVFREKYNLYAKTIYKIAFVYLKSHTDVEDALQEIFLKLLLKAPKFNSAEHEKAWLIRVTINTCKNMLKSLGRRETIAAMDELEQVGTPEGKNDEILTEILNLPDKYKAVIHLYYYEGYSVLQIAQILKTTQSAVKMRLKRGRDILKFELKDGGL